MQDGPGLRPQAVDAAQDAVYCLDRKSGRDALYRVALDGSMASTLVFEDPRLDVDDVLQLGRHSRLIGVTTTDPVHGTTYFDPEYKKLAVALSKALPGLPQIGFAGANADETRLLISAGSDTDAGRYYIYDKPTHHLNELALSRPQLEHVRLALMQTVSYKSADGTVIPAYLTLPLDAPRAGLPAIVLPHGGPASHDDWGFDWMVQFFASRGYAVLQPQFRGSTGFGKDFLVRNGFRSWRTSVGDVADAGRWLIAQGIADPARLAIFGWSYGGYAALQVNVLDNSLFKAVVAVAPVTDIDSARAEARGFTNAVLVSQYLGTGPEVAAGSPARHADMFKAPVLMFHGTADNTVSVAESRLMNDRLRAAGKASTLVIYPDLSHALADGGVRADMLRRSDAFLRASLHVPG